MRDTKDRGLGSVQAFSADGWRAFVAYVQSGTFDLGEPGRLV